MWRNDKSNHWFSIIVQIVVRWGRTCVRMSSACCDSGAAVCTNTWLSFVGKYNWGWRGVDTSSCLQGWNKDLTPAAVQRRHQLGLEPEKMSFTSSINTAVLSPSQPQVFLTFLHSLELSPRLFILLRSSNVFPSTSLCSLQSVPLPLQPEFLSLVLPPYFPWFSLLPLANPFQWHNTDFLPTFLPSLNISLCGTVALDFCDDFIPPLWAWVVVNSSGEWGHLRLTSAVCRK